MYVSLKRKEKEKKEKKYVFFVCVGIIRRQTNLRDFFPIIFLNYLPLFLGSYDDTQNDKILNFYLNFWGKKSCTVY